MWFWVVLFSSSAGPALHTPPLGVVESLQGARLSPVSPTWMSPAATRWGALCPRTCSGSHRTELLMAHLLVFPSLYSGTVYLGPPQGLALCSQQQCRAAGLLPPAGCAWARPSPGASADSLPAFRLECFPTFAIFGHPVAPVVGSLHLCPPLTQCMCARFGPPVLPPQLLFPFLCAYLHLLSAKASAPVVCPAQRLASQGQQP